MNLIHRRPAIATELFGQLWHCLWQRVLLGQSERCIQGSKLVASDHISQISDSLAETSLLSAAAELIGSTAMSSSPPSVNANAFPQLDGKTDGISPGELRGFFLPQLIRFLTSDEHVNPLENLPSSLGCLVAGLTTTTDSLLLSVPLPVLPVSLQFEWLSTD